MRASELTGTALDWAVAKCGGYFDEQPEYWESPAGAKHFLAMRNADGHGVHWTHASTDWAEGGPIIDREGIWTRTTDEGEDDPSCKWRAELPYRTVEVGPTPLIAAMRGYVASKLGDNIDIPEELKC
jgi:hypothetical protein